LKKLSEVLKELESKKGKKIELNGKDCPLLFGKHDVRKFLSFYEGAHSILYHDYELVFAFVHAESQFHDRDGTHYIDIHSIMSPSQYTPEGLFEPKILELYKHAKAFVIARFADTGLGKELESPSDFDTIQCHKNFESRNLEKRCSFRRKTGFQVDIDFERIKGKEDQKRIACEIADFLTEKVIKEFKVTDQKTFPADKLFGGGKLFELDNNLTYTFEYPDPYSPRTLYFAVTSNENGIMSFHARVTDFCRDYLNNHFKGELHTPNGEAVNMGLSGNGSYGLIDLSDIIPIEFSGKIFEGISTFQEK